MADQEFHRGWQVSKAAFLAKFVQHWLFFMGFCLHFALNVGRVLETRKLLYPSLSYK